MKTKISIALIILVTVSALMICVFAQTRTNAPPGDIRKVQQNIDRHQEEKRQALRDTLLMQRPIGGAMLIHAGSSPNATLLIGIGEDGKVVQAVIRRSDSSVTNFRKLRIEMLDGSSREIDLKQIKLIEAK